MGDADSTQIVMSAAEIEQWMDDALNDMDEGLNVLFSFMNLLNQRTVQMMSELLAWHRFRRCFTALNLFAVPILLAIGIVYGTSQLLEHSMSGIEAGLQSVVALLMFLSWSVGFPLYAFTVWQTYFDKSELDHVSTPSDRSGVWNQDKSSAGESNLTLPLVEESLLDIGRMINKRMRDGIRQEFERRINDAVEVQAVIDLSTSSEESDNFDEEITDDRNELPETGVADVPEAGGALSDIDCSEMFQKEQKPESCGVKFILLNALQNLSMETEKEALEDDQQEPVCDLAIKMLVDEMVSVQSSPRAIRSILVENIGEGDYKNSNALKKEDDLMRFVD